LQDAVDCYQKYLAAPQDKHNGEFTEVESWITESDSDWFCSFDNVCETLGIDPQYLRRGLLAWKEKQLAAGSAEKIARANPAGPGKAVSSPEFQVSP
jgi:hypothetical protein